MSSSHKTQINTDKYLDVHRYQCEFVVHPYVSVINLGVRRWSSVEEKKEIDNHIKQEYTPNRFNYYGGSSK